MVAAGTTLIGVAVPDALGSRLSAVRVGSPARPARQVGAVAPGSRAAVQVASSSPASDLAEDGAPESWAATALPPSEPWATPDGYQVAFTAADDDHRASLATSPVAKIEKGSGGRSLAFKITLKDGTVGYYKPEQTFSGTNWYAEVASYYLDRQLGLGRVPPTIGRRLPWAPLREVAGDDPRVSEVIVQDDGTVRGAFVWWIPQNIPPIDPGPYWERWIRFGAVDVSPLVPAYEWRVALKRMLAGKPAKTTADGTPRDPDTPDRPAELSDMILFDYLTNDPDRWGSDYTNVRTRGPHGPLIYLDNAAGFFPGSDRISLMDSRLAMVQKFRRRTIEAIRGFDLDRFRRWLATDPLAPILDEHYLDGLEARRQYLLDYVAKVERQYGDAAFPW